MLTTDIVFSELQKLKNARQFLIAYSGGLDSSVLLHLMQAIREQHPEVELRAVHVNHHLSANANDWEKHAVQICEHLKIPLRIHSINLDHSKKQSIEEQARQARLHYFAEILLENECLLTAHHLNDQA